MRVTIVRPGDLGPSEASLWALFQKSSPELQNPFFSLTFARTVDRYRPNSRVAVVEDDGAIQAFLPFDLGPQRIGVPIGDPMNNLQGFISEGGATIDARRVIRKAGLRGWRFTAAPAGQGALAAHHYEGTLVEAPVVDLSDGYERYFAGLSKKFLSDYNRKWRALERDLGPLSLEWGATELEPVRRLMDWKSARYWGARLLFAEAAARSIVEELRVSTSEDCRGVVNVLRAGDQVVAISINLTCPGVLCGWFMAYDHDLKKYSPGTTVMIATFEEAERRHITRIDMGAGQDSYKSRVTNASYPVAGGAVWVIPAERAARGLYRRWRGQAGASPPASSALSERMAMTMQVTVVRPAELGIGEEKQWREFQTSYLMAAHPNYSLTFARAACRADENGRVAVVEDGGVICAFLPYTKGNDGIATVLGGGQAGVDGVISSNDPVDLRQVVRRAGLRGWRFGHAPAEQAAVDPYRYEGGYHSQEARFADLRGGYGAYLQALPKSVTKRIARTAGYRRALERELGDVRLEWNSSDPAVLSLLLKWKSAQFEYVRQWLSAPSSRPMVDELAASDNEDCTGVTSVLYAGSKPVSIVLSLRSSHIIIPWILAYDPEYSRFSPGTIEWLALFEEAAACGVQILDFGYGDERYKDRFGNGSYMLGGGAVWARRLESAARSVYRRTRFRD